MISQKLAKQLKDAGFPQGNFVIDAEHQAYQPTLSELIEACGFRFNKIAKHINEIDRYNGIEWYAESLEPTTNDSILEYGNTPEEAVANLWLKLNKKK